MDNFSKYKINNNGETADRTTFKYKWLLRKLKEEPGQSGRRKISYAKPYEIPINLETNDLDPNLRKFFSHFDK